MYSAYCLARNVEVFNAGAHTCNVNVYTAVLVVKGRVHKYRLLANINTVACEHTHHSGYSLFDSALAADFFNHRGIKPNSLAAACIYAFFAVGAFSYNGSRRNVARFKRVHKYLAVAVYKLSA